MLSAPSLQNHSIPPRSTEKSYRLRASNRTMVGVLEPSRVACAASGPKASNHQVMRPASRNCRLPWSVRSTSRIQSLSRSQIGLDANHHIHHLSERTEGNSFLDIPSHRTHPEWFVRHPVISHRDAQHPILPGLRSDRFSSNGAVCRKNVPRVSLPEKPALILVLRKRKSSGQNATPGQTRRWIVS